MPRYRATEPIRLDGTRIEPGDAFETTEAIGAGLVNASAAVLLDAPDEVPAADEVPAPVKTNARTRAKS